MRIVLVVDLSPVGQQRAGVASLDERRVVVAFLVLYRGFFPRTAPRAHPRCRSGFRSVRRSRGRDRIGRGERVSRAGDVANIHLHVRHQHPHELGPRGRRGRVFQTSSRAVPCSVASEIVDRKRTDYHRRANGRRPQGVVPAGRRPHRAPHRLLYEAWRAR